jgi:hypothetical protein
MEDFYVLRNGRAFFEYFVYGFMRKFTGCEPNQLPAPASVTEMPRFAVLRREQNSAGSAPAQTRVKWLHPARGTQQIVDALLRGADAGRIEFQLNTEVSALNVKEGDKRLDAHVLSCYYCLP